MNIFFKNLIIVLFIFFSHFYIWNANWDDNINFTVSPIKYEIEASTWTTITEKALLFNRTNSTITIYTWVSDFEAKDDSWNPRFIKKSSDELTWQELSNWITIEQTSFDIWPKEKKEIDFTINVPENATPWWHYWAVFFKNNNSWDDLTWQIKINVDYWVLLLVNVDWEIIIDWETEDTNIIINSWWWWGYSEHVEDECQYFDFTSSSFDNKCFDDLNDIIWLIIDPEDEIDEEDIDLNSADEDFSIDFETPFDNNWNTHIKPIGKITLIDKDWNEIKWIWKESILNEDWAIIWEKIVDYLPINDIWWNVLPGTSRTFDSEWRWFPYKNYDGTIKYWTPEEYYTKKNFEENKYLMPWERFNTRICDETIKVITKISYIDENWEEVKFNSAQDLNIKYKETYVWLNPYALVCIWFMFFILWLLWLLFKKKKRKCKKCWKKINKDMKICPYCWKKQKNKK